MPAMTAVVAVVVVVVVAAAHLKRDGTCAETRCGLSTKWISPFKFWGGGGLFSRLLAAKVCASAVVMVVMLDTPCSEVECKTTGYPLHSHVSPSLHLTENAQVTVLVMKSLFLTDPKVH